MEKNAISLEIYITRFPIYLTFIIISIVVNYLFVMYFAKKKNIDKNLIVTSIIYEIFGIIIGGKLFTLFLSIGKVEDLSFFNFLKLGFTSYGGLIGGLLLLFIFIIQFKLNKLEMLGVYIVPVPIMYSISKLGCLFAGCCYGKPYSGVFNIKYINSETISSNVTLFPIQLLETITFFISFIYIAYCYLKDENLNKVIGKCFVICGILKFIGEFFRASYNGILTSVNQQISIIFILIGILFYIRKSKEKGKKKYE